MNERCLKERKLPVLRIYTDLKQDMQNRQRLSKLLRDEYLTACKHRFKMQNKNRKKSYINKKAE